MSATRRVEPADDLAEPRRDPAGTPSGPNSSGLSGSVNSHPRMSPPSASLGVRQAPQTSRPASRAASRPPHACLSPSLTSCPTRYQTAMASSRVSGRMKPTDAPPFTQSSRTSASF